MISEPKKKNLSVFPHFTHFFYFYPIYFCFIPIYFPIYPYGIRCHGLSVFSSVQLLSHVQIFITSWTALPLHSPTPGVYPNSSPLSHCCHPTILSSVIPFASHLQSFPTSGSFPMSQLFASVAKVSEFQHYHQSYQLTPRTDLL